MEAAFDKSYVVAQLGRANEYGLLKEAVGIVAGDYPAGPGVDWHRVRMELDKILPGITEPIAKTPPNGRFSCNTYEIGGYPAYLGNVRLRVG
jgi:hypothetical protein